MTKFCVNERSISAICCLSATSKPCDVDERGFWIVLVNWNNWSLQTWLDLTGYRFPEPPFRRPIWFYAMCSAPEREGDELTQIDRWIHRENDIMRIKFEASLHGGKCISRLDGRCDSKPASNFHTLWKIKEEPQPEERWRWRIGTSRIGRVNEDHRWKLESHTCKSIYGLIVFQPVPL